MVPVAFQDPARLRRRPGRQRLHRLPRHGAGRRRPAPAGNGQPTPGIPIVPAPRQPCQSAGDQCGPHATLEESDGKTTSLASNSPATSSSGSRRHAAWLVRAARRGSDQPPAGQNYVRSATNVPESVRSALDKRIQAQMLTTVRDEERIVAERAEQQRLLAASDQRSRAVTEFTTNQDTIKAMMTQFALLMDEGDYNVLYGGGYGNITAAAAPFYSARVLAQHARALMRRGTQPYSDWDPAPYAGMFTSMTTAFLPQELQFRQLKWFRYMLTMQDVTRAGVPFPDNQYIEYPDAEVWRTSPSGGSPDTARPSTSSTATPRPSRSRPSSTRRSPCRSPTRLPWKTC